MCVCVCVCVCVRVRACVCVHVHVFPNNIVRMLHSALLWLVFNCSFLLSSQFTPALYNDGKLEVVGLAGVMHMVRRNLRTYLLGWGLTVHLEGQWGG